MSYKKQLQKIITNEKPVGKKDFFYKGKPRTFDVYEIPLKFLLFNPENGRIASLNKEYEQINGQSLNSLPEKERTDIIASWLYQKNKDRNDKTYEDIKIKGQMEPGVVTIDGLIVDGNRRFMTLRRIQKEDGVDKYYKAVILNHSYEDSDYVLDIKKLETSIQMGADDKLGFDPIEKYLKVKDFRENFKNQISDKEIAIDMGLKDESEVIQLHDIAKLMERYLKFCHMPNMYTVISKQEDLFINLDKVYKLYEKGKGKVTWTPEPDDLNDFLNVAFYTIRYIYNKKNSFDDTTVKKVRSLLFQNSNHGIFNKKELFEDFKDNIKFDNLHEVLPKQKQQKEVQEHLDNGHSPQEAYTMVNESWAQAVSTDRFKKGIDIAKSTIDAKKTSNRPKELLMETFTKLLQFVDKDEWKINKKIELLNAKILFLKPKDKETKEYITGIKKIAEKLEKDLKL